MVGEINLDGSIEPIHHAVTMAEIAIEKGSSALLMPVSCRRQLIDLSDDMATKNPAGGCFLECKWFEGWNGLQPEITGKAGLVQTAGRPADRAAKLFDPWRKVLNKEDLKSFIRRLRKWAF